MEEVSERAIVLCLPGTVVFGCLCGEGLCELSECELGDGDGGCEAVCMRCGLCGRAECRGIGGGSGR